MYVSLLVCNLCMYEHQQTDSPAIAPYAYFLFGTVAFFIAGIVVAIDVVSTVY